MIWEATAIHTAYPEYLNSQLRTQIFQTGENPFLSPMFKRVETADMRANIIDDVEPCIVLATSGMMSGGPVLEEFKCSDLASGLYKKFGLEARSPMNLETIRLR